MMRNACVLALVAALGATAAGRRSSFDDDWKFLKGEAPGAEQPSFNDSSWRSLTLPHDWAIEGPFDVSYGPSTGGLPISGTGWYRKHFTVPASERGRYFSIEFDGAMSNSTVWINGHELGERPYGYSSFAYDLTANLNFGGDNVIAVRLMPEERSSRWYPGAGLYRNVWMVVTGAVHVAHWGTYVTTPDVSPESAGVSVKSEVQNRGGAPASVIVETAILDPSGKQVGRQSSNVTIAPDAISTVAASIKVSSPKRWDLKTPYLYQAVTTVLSGKQELDRYVTPFGIRSIEFNHDKGLLLNGRAIKINGVCDHSDLGALGAAINTRAIERQLQILKDMGINALRTSHNPPAPEVLEACDRMGIMVMDEAFDMWNIPKVPNGYAKYFAKWGEQDMRDFLRRDRNHPSVILWSIGNEVPEQNHADGWQTAKMLTGIAHEVDPTRPTTSAFNSWQDAIKNGLADQVDIPGFNYAPTHYEQIQKDHPKWVIFGSETESCVSSRGVYDLPVAANAVLSTLQVSSFDTVAPSWAYCPDVEFTYQDRLPNVLGEFVWTGFDYLGEPTPYGRPSQWPSRSSYFGIVDLAGFPKDRYYLYQSKWTEKPVLHLLPHWNWAGKEGQVIPVMAYTNADEVELFVNGKSAGRKKLGIDTVTIPVNPVVSPTRQFTSKYRLEWDVPYQPGSIRAVGFKNGKQVAVDEIKTAGQPARIRLIPDRSKIAADGKDLSFITVRIEDKDGNLCPLADNLVQFHVEGAGVREAVDNGNAATTEPFQADQRKAFNGLALLIVRSKDGQPGRIQVTATSEGLAKATADLSATK
ncbi:MAG TPA: beta-galactosidase GalB [Bryobacteraceae bacterium]|nr:beta-galactosidase GalB [Bryobacteraceae bacterium]